jgi:HEAT repeat protein
MIGRSDRVAAMVRKAPEIFPELISGLWSEDPLVRMRAADAAEKVTRQRPELLLPYKRELLGLMAETEQQELRWHLAAMVPRLRLNARQRKIAVSALGRYLEDRSSIVKTSALQGLADLARDDPGMQPSVIEILHEATRSGTPAMKARSRKLLLRLEGWWARRCAASLPEFSDLTVELFQFGDDVLSNIVPFRFGIDLLMGLYGCVSELTTFSPKLIAGGDKPGVEVSVMEPYW